MPTTGHLPADYAAIKADVARICARPDVVAAYGLCDLTKTHPAIVDMLVDLHARGDYTGPARALVQLAAARNDLAGFAEAMKKASNWPNVPEAKFSARLAVMVSADGAEAERHSG